MRGRHKPSLSEWAKWKAESPVGRMKWTRPQRLGLEALREGRDLIVMPGGNGAGKTWSAVSYAVGACEGQWEYLKAPASVVLMGNTFDQIRESMRPKLEALIDERMLKSQPLRHKGMIEWCEWWNGSALSVGSYEAGQRRAQGARRTILVLDETPPEEILEESLFRYTDQMESPRIVIAATPTEGRSYLYTDWVQQREKKGVTVIPNAVFENGSGTCPRCELSYDRWTQRLTEMGWTRDFEQNRSAAYQWMERQIQACVQAEPANWIEGHCGRCWTYGVNPRIKSETVRQQLFRVEDRRRIAMRFLGSYEELSGMNVFTTGQTEALQRFVREPERQEGPWAVWNPPAYGHTYSMGIDCSRGVGKDETVFSMLDNVTGELVAVWGDAATQYTEYLFDIVEIGLIYHSAMLVPEWASAGEGVIPLLLAHNYPTMYTYVPPNQLLKDAVGEKPGFVSTPRNRNRILMQVIDAIVKGLVQRPEGGWEVMLGNPEACYVRDPKTVAQLVRLFYNTEDGDKIQVPAGQSSHDDRVIALALAWEGRLHPHTSRTAPDTGAQEAARMRRAFYQQEAAKAQRGPGLGRGRRISG